MGNVPSGVPGGDTTLAQLVQQQGDVGDAGFTALQAVAGLSAMLEGAPNDALVKAVQYLPPAALRKALSARVTDHDGAVVAGILEMSDTGVKRETLAHRARELLGAAGAIVPVGTAAAFERRQAAFLTALGMCLTPVLKPGEDVPDNGYRPDVLPKGTRVCRGRDWP